VKAVYSDISQSFTNLINNAIESMHDSKERNIWVRTYQASNMVAIEVRDSGEGIEEKYHKKYLNPIIPQKRKKLKAGLVLVLQFAGILQSAMVVILQCAQNEIKEVPLQYFYLMTKSEIYLWKMI